MMTPANGSGKPDHAPSVHHPASASPAKRFLDTWDGWGIGTLGLGIVLVIVAIVLHDHNAYPNAMCHAGLGELGQAFSGSAYAQCSAPATAEEAVGPLVFFGVGALVVGGAKIALSLAAAFAVTERGSAPRPASAGQKLHDAGSRPTDASSQPGAAQPRLAGQTRRQSVSGPVGEDSAQ
jgi:hypothetical protein